MRSWLRLLPLLTIICLKTYWWISSIHYLLNCINHNLDSSVLKLCMRAWNQPCQPAWKMSNKNILSQLSSVSASRQQQYLLCPCKWGLHDRCRHLWSGFNDRVDRSKKTEWESYNCFSKWQIYFEAPSAGSGTLWAAAGESPLSRHAHSIKGLQRCLPCATKLVLSHL